MLTKFLDPKNDFAFKKIFGTEKNKDILIHFLDGHKEIWEIKPEGQTELEKNLENFRKNSFFETLSKKFPALSFFGPHPALLEKIRGQYRYHFLLKGPKSKEIFAASFELKKFFSKTILKPSKWWVDVDPVSML